MNPLLPSLAIGVLSLGLFHSIAHANSPASIIQAQTEELKLRGGMGDVEMYCKHKFKVSIDAASFSKVVAKNESKAGNLARHCRNPISAVRHLCAMGYDKEVKSQISSYVCQYKEGKPKMSLKKGVLTMTTNWEREPNDWSKKAVGNVLRKGEFSVSQAALIKNDKGRIKSAMADMKRRCGHQVKWKVDWKSFEGRLNSFIADDNQTAIWQQCVEPLSALEGLCASGQAKLMKQQVSSYVCRYDKDVDANMVLKGKTLSLTSNFQPKGMGLAEWAKNLVGDTLRDGDYSVRQAGFMRNENADLQRLYSTNTDERCKTKIAASIDWKSFLGEVDKRLSKQSKTSIYDSCAVPLARLADVCGSDPKNKVKAKIKSYTCTMGGTKKRKLTLKGGNLHYYVDFRADDSYGYTDTFLVKNRVIKKKPKPKKLSPKDLAKIRQILGQGANTQSCYKSCAGRRGARARQQCRNTCQ